MIQQPGLLTGSSLTPDSLAALSEGIMPITLSQDGMGHITQARKIVNYAVAQGIPIYGVTTGLGSRATEALSPEALAGFSVETLNGRAHALGPPLPALLVRATMIVRLNTMLSGASGASPAIARHLLATVNAGLVPQVGRWGSIGAADLLPGASLARAIMGIGGTMAMPDGTLLPSLEALTAVDLTPPALGPRDGLALANHACFSAAAAALAVRAADRSLRAALSATALSLLGFQSNLTPIDPDVLTLKPHRHDQQTGTDLLTLLQGADICDPAQARRLQDPLSLRNAVQVLGSARQALDQAAETVSVEINGSSDNPAVLLPEGRIVSTGNYFTPHLTLACETLARALSALATLAVARMAKLCAERLSGLPLYLADPEIGTNGFAPILKLAESLLAEIHRAAMPLASWPSLNADGVEDALTHSLSAALTLSDLVGLLNHLIALECLVAAQAMDLRGTPVPENLRHCHDMIRAASPRIRESRPLGEDIERIAALIAAGRIG